MKTYDTPTLEIEWYTVQTVFTESTTVDPDKEDPDTQF